MPEIVADNISVINSDELEGATRIEAEYYQPSYLSLMKSLKRIPTVQLSTIAFVTDGIHASIDYDDEDNIRCLSAQSVKDNLFDLSANTFISEEQHNKNLRTSLKSGDVIISSVGTIGNCAVVTNDMLPANADRHVAIIRLLNGKLSPFYLSAFFNSKYGKFQTSREATGNVQLNLFIDKIKKLVIPQLKESGEIGKSVKSARELILSANSLYSQAEALLLEELGIKDIDLSHEPCYEVNSADTITANRIDAEYYQPKYERVIEAIKNCKYGWCKLDGRIMNITDKYDPKKEPEKDFRYIELSNINPSNGVIDGYSELKGKDLPSRARMLIKEGDVIISSVEGSIDKVALVDNHHDGCLASTGFFVFRSKENMLPEYTLVLCKSILIQKQLEKLSSGTILTAVPKNLVQNIIIPNVPKEAQTEIANLIRKSHSVRRQAKKLLEEAKRKVEDMIEKE